MLLAAGWVIKSPASTIHKSSFLWTSLNWTTAAVTLTWAQVRVSGCRL